jgi:predicted ArsR family transcriptional regulator
MTRSLRAAVSGKVLTAHQRAAHEAAEARVLTQVPVGPQNRVSIAYVAICVGISAEQTRRHIAGLVGRGLVKRQKIGHAHYFYRPVKL